MAYQRKTKDIHISPKLTEILEKISVNSEVARLMLKTKISKEDLVDDPIDYLSVAKEDPTKISYAYADKLEKADPEEYWSFKGRVQAKPAAAIKKFLKTVSEKDLDIFTSLYKAAVADRDFIFKVVKGDDIKTYYHQNSYKNLSGNTLYNSCMKHDHCSTYFDVYIDNPEVCEMLVMLDMEGLLLGRALLWKAVDVEAGIERKIMDRIYAIDDNKNMHYFKEWANENGYTYKKEQKWPNSLQFESNGFSHIYKLSVKIKNKIYDKYPYVDTFKFWDEKNGIISNFAPKDNGYIRTLIGNDGRVFGSDILDLDTLDMLYYHRDHLRLLKYPINGVYHTVVSENAYYSECMDMYIHRNHQIFDEEIQDYIFNELFSINNDVEKIEKRRLIYKQAKEERTLSKKSAVVESTTEIWNYDYSEDIVLNEETDVIPPSNARRGRIPPFSAPGTFYTTASVSFTNTPTPEPTMGIATEGNITADNITNPSVALNLDDLRAMTTAELVRYFSNQVSMGMTIPSDSVEISISEENVGNEQTDELSNEF